MVNFVNFGLLGKYNIKKEMASPLPGCERINPGLPAMNIKTFYSLYTDVTGKRETVLFLDSAVSAT